MDFKVRNGKKIQGWGRDLPVEERGKENKEKGRERGEKLKDV